MEIFFMKQSNPDPASFTFSEKLWAEVDVGWGEGGQSQALLFFVFLSKLEFEDLIFIIAGGAVQEEPFVDWQAGRLQVFCWDHKIGVLN